MSNYTKTTNFTAKDSLATGDPNKIVLGAEHDTEYSAIAVAIATKLDTTGSAASLTALPAAQGGSLLLLNKTAASGASSVAWDNTYLSSTYKAYWIIATDIVLSTTASIYVQFSDDNASTWISSYEWSRWGANSGDTGTDVAITADNSDTQIVIAGGFTTAYVTAINTFLYLNTGNTQIAGTLAFAGTSIATGSTHHHGSSETDSVNAIRILPSTGTFTGTFSIYGIKTV